MPPNFYLRVPTSIFHHKQADELLDLIDQDDATDVCLVVGEKEVTIKAHSAVLSALSEYFKAMFSCDKWREKATGIVELPNLVPAAVRAAVAWMYTGHCCSQCFLYAPLSSNSSAAFKVDAFKRSFQIPITLHYFLIHPKPPYDTFIQEVCSMIRTQSNSNQVECWKTIQKARIDEITAAVVPKLVHFTDVKHLISLVKVTEDVEHMKILLDVAIKQDHQVGSVSDAFQFIHCLAEWVEKKRGEEGVEVLKAMQFDFIDQLGAKYRQGISTFLLVVSLRLVLLIALMAVVLILMEG
ncbi:hypothetical protein HDV00_000848 [Rhizophlyctis rosea]|nr:hypothetical protein HDV00_000848 [Rhizophlyctis rosea]